MEQQETCVDNTDNSDNTDKFCCLILLKNTNNSKGVSLHIQLLINKKS